MNVPETEAKFYVRDLAGVESRLRALNAELIHPRVHETNLRFDTAARDLKKQGRVLRLRMDDQASLTYKGPSANLEGVMSREEIEFVVEDFESARGLVEALGYELTAYYEKFRTTYALGDLHIMLDELPFGNFVEIEGSLPALIQKMAEQLGLHWESAIARSYLGLFEHVAAIRQLDPARLSFDVFQRGEPAAAELGVIAAD